MTRGIDYLVDLTNQSLMNTFEELGRTNEWLGTIAVQNERVFPKIEAQLLEIESHLLRMKSDLNFISLSKPSDAFGNHVPLDRCLRL